MKDTQVGLKRDYNRLNASRKNLLTGDEWYEIQAYRAVNQGFSNSLLEFLNSKSVIFKYVLYAKRWDVL